MEGFTIRYEIEIPKTPKLQIREIIEPLPPCPHPLGNSVPRLHSSSWCFLLLRPTKNNNIPNHDVENQMSCTKNVDTVTNTTQLNRIDKTTWTFETKNAIVDKSPAVPNTLYNALLKTPYHYYTYHCCFLITVCLYNIIDQEQ